MSPNPLFVQAPPTLAGWYPVIRSEGHSWEPFYFSKDSGKKWICFEGDHADTWDSYVRDGALVNHTRLEPK